MADQPEYLVGLTSLVAQMSDPAAPVLARIAATNLARTYLEAMTASLVEEARDGGATWLQIADVFATSESNIKARFAPLHDYGDS